MRHPHTTRTIGRTVVVGTWLVALAVAGDPTWLAVLLGAGLVLVWASPYLLVTNRQLAAHGRPSRARSAGRPGSAGPAA
jgi:hypothetical protein